MFLASVMDRGATPALVKTLAFNESRLRMISENVANALTPGYKAKQLDVAAFRGSLREALDRRSANSDAPFQLRESREVGAADGGFLRVTPSLVPVENILSHDGTNVSIERQMTELAETGMIHELAASLLRGRIDGLRKAIRGTVA